MSQLSRSVPAAVAIALTMACSGQAQQGQQSKPAQPTTTAAPATNQNAEVLQDFKTRIAAYLKLHNDLEKQSPKLRETEHPEKITASQEALAAKLRVARKDAKPGDIFTPPIRTLLRRLMYPELKGADGPETKALMNEDKPGAGAVALKVNGAYPSSAPLATVPPNVLASLPPLPDELEYRFVDKHLILRDVHANLIVDYILNAVQ